MCKISELPEYEYESTPEEWQETLAMLDRQIRHIISQQKDEVPAKFTKIRCCCNKLVLWKYAYRCLYCSLWFCRECAQLHFGYRIPDRMPDGQIVQPEADDE